MPRWKKTTALVAGLLLAGAIGAGGAAWAGGGDPPESGAGQAPGGGGDATTNIILPGPTDGRYVAVAPCRLVDTRVAGGRLGDRDIRRYDVGGDGTTFAGQGGTPGGCDIPAFGISAVEITVTAVDTTGTGFVRIFPAGVGDATFMNYTPTFNASNTGTVVTCEGDGGPCDPAQDIGVRNYGTTTHLVIDVQGYYAAPLAAVVNDDGTLHHGSRVTSTERLSEGKYNVRFDQELTRCAFVGSIGSGSPSGTYDGQIQVQQNSVFDDGAYIATFDSSGASSDRDFEIHVVC